jgi:hypothetical protein
MGSKVGQEPCVLAYFIAAFYGIMEILSIKKPAIRQAKFY